MDREWIRERLPHTPSEEMLRWVRMSCGDELGEEYLIFRGERVRIRPTMAEILERECLPRDRWEWAAYCTCTACREDFYTQKVPGYDAIRLAVSEDGCSYPLEPGEVYPAGEYQDVVTLEEAHSGETLYCPMCGNNVKLIHSKYLRGGRTKRIMVQSVDNIEGYTTVFYWMACRTVDEDGVDLYRVEPMDAYVLTERGGLERYTHVQKNTFGYRMLKCWCRTGNCKDTRDYVYKDWGSIANRKMGAMEFGGCPNLGGTTGEKTGLEEFMAAGGYNAVQYLKYWRTHRNIENMVKCGQGELVLSIFREANRYCSGVDAEMKKYLDMTRKKPHEMLRISKEEFRKIRNNRICLHANDLDYFTQYRKCGGKLSLPEFLNVLPSFGRSGISAAMQIMMQSRGADLDKITRYMEKQNMRANQVQYLVDVRRMHEQINDGQPMTQEQLWPRRLAAAHDRADQILMERRRLAKEEERKKYDRKFEQIAQKYTDLQWNDGDLCVVLPMSAKDLHDEGKILRHCVGGYSDRHISGSDTIFFVRKYRRPERSYYTLDIRMNKERPEEVQLHGYGNERHGKNKEFTHSIPKKVRDFVDRWEREVLLPWWAAHQEQDRKEKTA